MRLLLLAIGIVFTLSCQDSQFQSGNAVSEAEPEALIEEPQTEDVVRQEPFQPEKEIIIEETSLDEQLKASFYSYGKPDQAVDYLFVIDNSVSMGSILTLVNQGFASILGNNIFPPNSQVAVMSTMIADPNNFAAVSPFIREYDGIQLEPGFLDFVDQNSIKNYRDNVPGEAGKWPLDGCANKWFKPDDKNATGQYCLTAHTQSTFSALIAEAGITAYEQLLIKRMNNPTFRENSLVNVIFVSDTHDPGANEQELIDNRKNYAQLDVLTKTYNKIKGLKFHAMAPATKCTGENLHDLSYYLLVDQSNGQKGDSCVTTDYTEFLTKMVEASIIQEPVFGVSTEIKDVLKVEVEGKEVKDFEISEDKMSITIPGLDPKTPVSVSITYSTPLS